MNDRIAALDFVTRCLGSDRDPKEITTLRSHITSGDLVWQSIADLANDHLVTPALWVALKEKELVEPLPEDVREYLKALHRLNGRRNEHLKRQIVEVTRRLNDIGIKPVLLKGAVHLFSNTFSDPASRVMIDLDILVAQQDLLKYLEHFGLSLRQTAASKTCASPPLCATVSPRGLRDH